MAIRAALSRRYLCTSSLFCSPTTTTAYDSFISSDSKPAPPPSTTLFVAGLNKKTTSDKLREAFSKFGEVVKGRVVADRVSGYSKGYGFIDYASLEDAEAGIKGMDGESLDGWVIFVEYAWPRTPSGSQHHQRPIQMVDGEMSPKR